MLRYLLTKLARLISNTFFRRIDVTGLDNVPAAGPVIFAGNHPNALMDGWLLAAHCGRSPLSFLADAKLWQYRLLGPLLTASGAVPVHRREDRGPDADNTDAFERLYEVIAAGDCIGIFPEGVSHAESRLGTLKTGTARIALEATARGIAGVRIVPCGLNYIHRHRFRSQVLIEFGRRIDVDDALLADYRSEPRRAVAELTDRIAVALSAATLNAPDWATLRFIQAARRLYKPSSTVLTPGQYVELNRRFVERYLEKRTDPELRMLREKIEDYQSQLDLLGLKDYQLRQPVTPGRAFRRVLLRGLTMLVLLPAAVPGALLHLPVGWIAAKVGEHFSYEMDDIATLKVFSALLLLPLLYGIVAVAVGAGFGIGWGLATLIFLPASFFVSVRLIEAEAGLLLSMLSLFRLSRLGREAGELRERRAALVDEVRSAVERHAPPDEPRLFTAADFASGDLEKPQ